MAAAAPIDFEAISKLSEVELLNKDALPALEAYVAWQVKSGEWDDRANRAILRLYQFFPHLLKRDIVEFVLVKALMNLPQPSFGLCLCQLPEEVADKASVRVLSSMEKHLQSGQFQEFWRIRATDEATELLASVPTFDAAIRKFIVLALTITYQSVSDARLRQALNLADISAVATEQGWTLAAGTVTFTKNAYNAPQPPQAKQAVGLEEMSGLLRVLNK